MTPDRDVLREARKADLHVMPIYITDIEREWGVIDDADAPHQEAVTCWCQPIIDYEDPVTGGRVYVHRRHIDSPQAATVDRWWKP